MMSPLLAGAALALTTLMTVTGVESAEIKHRDGVHRIEKRHVTIMHDMVRRDQQGLSCPSRHDLCQASLGGGCCPDGYNCATDSCYATTSATQSCGGSVGWYGCPMEVAGGCCPVGYICRRGDCAPPEGSAYSQECPTNHFLCPSSLNYGCCPNNMGCAARACYSTEPSTWVITRTVTTTDASAEEVTTIERETTVSTPVPPTAFATADAGEDGSQVVVKFYPDSVPKVDPEETLDDDGSGGGLTTGHIIGVVIGVVALLVIVVVAAWIVIRRLNKVVKVVESKQSTSRDSLGTKERPVMVHYHAGGSGKPTPSEIDDMSIDPLMVTSPRPSHRRFDSDSDGAGIGLPSPTLASPSPYAPGGYHAVPNSAMGQDIGHDTNFQGGGGYFDALPDRSQRASGQSGTWAAHRLSADSQAGQAQGYGHARQWSNASDQTVPGVNSTAWSNPQELDSKVLTPELHGVSVVSPVDIMSPDLGNPRRVSDGSIVSAVTVAEVPGTSRTTTNVPRRRGSEGRSRPDGAASTAVGQGTLSVVAEDSELIGLHGPNDRATGQTTAGLGMWDWDTPEQQFGPR